MKKIAVIRGSNLNKYEMQSFEPLTSKFEVHAFAARRTPHGVEDICLPVHRLLCSEDLVEYLLPRRVCTYGKFLLSQIIGVNQMLVGLPRRLKGFDVVHTADVGFYYSYQAAKAKKRLGFKLIVTQWENIPFLDEGTRRVRRIKRQVLEATDHFVAMSRRAKEILTLEGVDEKRISVLPPGIDTQRFKPGNKDGNLLRVLGASEQDTIISYVGRLGLSKGVEFLLWAFKKLKSDPAVAAVDGRIKLALFGAGRQEKKLRALAQRLDLSRDICFYGFYPYDKIEKVYATTDIFVLPSVPAIFPFPWQEQLGMVLLESMACRCPVVATQSGSIPEVVGDAGLQCQAGDFLDLYEKLRVLCLNRALRQELGQKGRKRVEQVYNARCNAERMAELYESL